MKAPDVLRRQATVRKIVACPGCQSGLRYSDKTVCGGFTVAARLDCKECGTVGHVCNGQHIFNGIPHLMAGKAEKLDGSLLQTLRPLTECGFDLGPDWRINDRMLSAATEQAECVFETDAIAISLSFHRSDWSGIVELAIDDLEPTEIDLFHRYGSSELYLPIHLGSGRHRVAIRCTGRANERSHAAECHILSLGETHFFSSIDEPMPQPESDDLLPFPAGWEALVSAVGLDDLILHLGSNRSSPGSARHVRCDFHSRPQSDIAAPPGGLPVKSAAFALVFAQSALNRVPDPQGLVEQLHRILKPGGAVFTETAAFQPAIDSKDHYFSATKAGIAHLFRDFEILELEERGSLSQTLEWLIGSLALLGEEGKAQADLMISTVRNVENHFSDAARERCASYIETTARKRK